MAPIPDPHVEPWSLRDRALILVIAAIAPWIAILWLARSAGLL